MTITHLVTHSGGFHADELLSTVILSRLFPEAALIRTRDEAWITSDAPTDTATDTPSGPPSGTTPDCASGATRIIYDVGRMYCPDTLVFDHHQRPNPLRENGQPYSSFGLIWHHYGRDYLRASDVPETDIDDIHRSIDASFVLPIDLMDNGALEPSVAGPLAGMTLPVLLETLKPAFDNRSPDADDQAFAQALPVARAFVEAAVRGKAARRRAESIVRGAIEQAGASPVLELPMGMPFRAAIDKAGADHLLFVIHPRDTDWALTTIRKNGDTFESRADLPEAWAGLTDAALEQASGVAGAKFCHNGRFIAVAGTRDAALQMASLAVANLGRATAASGRTV